MYIGIDLGGTNIAAGIVDDKGQIIAKDSTPTLKARRAEEITDDIIMLIKRITEDSGYAMSDIKGIGIGCPCSVDDNNGIIINSTNLKMEGFNIAGYIENAVGIRARLANDADCAALGEYSVNSGGAKNFVFITLGTGVGGGIIIGGRIYTAFNSISPELGHITIRFGGVECGCGKRGCLEAYASVTALIRQTMTAMSENPDSLMNQIAAENGKVTGRTAFDAAKRGDAAARAVVEQYAKYIADGVVSVENMLQPDVIVIGGGISKEGDYLLNPVMEYVSKYRFNKNAKQTEIKIAKLFNDAGIIGAAMLCKV